MFLFRSCSHQAGDLAGQYVALRGMFFNAGFMGLSIYHMATMDSVFNSKRLVYLILVSPVTSVNGDVGKFIYKMLPVRFPNQTTPRLGFAPGGVDTSG